MKNTDTQAAKELGRSAFARGVKCAPALDAEFCKTLSGLSTKATIAVLDAWIAGWTEANLADEPAASDDEMSDDEIAGYRFRVGRTHFQDFDDAQTYAESCLYADRVDHLCADGVWREFWTDGEIEYNRAGFGVLKVVSHASRSKAVI